MSITLQQRVIKEFNKLNSSIDDQYAVCLFLQTILEKLPSDPPKSGRLIRIEGVDPFEISSVISTSGAAVGSGVFNTFNNAQLASLSPLIRIFLRTRLGNGGYKIDEINLQNVQPEHEILKSVNDKGSVFGIKDINISLAGKSPETAKNDINSTLTFFGSSLAVFENHPELVNLIVPHVKRGKSKSGVESELVLQVGWNTPSAQAIKNLEFTDEQINAIKSQFETYVMLYVGHDFAFNIDGSFTLRCEYASFIDQKIANANFLVDNAVVRSVYGNITKTPAAAKSLTDSEKDLIRKYIKANHDSASTHAKGIIFNKLASQSDIPKFLKTIEKDLREKVDVKIQDLFNDLKFEQFQFRRDTTRIHLLYRACATCLPPGKRTKNQIMNLAADVLTPPKPAANMSQNTDIISPFTVFYRAVANAIIANVPNLSRAEAVALTKAQLVAWGGRQSTTPQQVKYFYNVANVKKIKDNNSGQVPKFIAVTTFGEIVDCFIRNNDNLQAQFAESNMHIALGTIKVTSIQSNKYATRTKKPVILNLYDIPVTYETLVKVTRKYYLNKTKKQATLLSFIQALLDELKKYFLQGDPITESDAFIGANSLRAGQFTCTLASVNQLRRSAASFFKTGYRAPLRTALEMNPDNISNLHNVYYIVAGPASDDISTKRSLQEVDHYQIGSANSVVKKVSYTQANNSIMEAIRSDNIAAAYRHTSNLTVLPQLYNVKINIFGNLNFIPGYLFSLLPTTLGVNIDKVDSIVKTLGLLGTYMTLKVEHSIGMNGFTTTLHAYNVATDKYIKKVVG